MLDHRGAGRDRAPQCQDPRRRGSGSGTSARCRTTARCHPPLMRSSRSRSTTTSSAPAACRTCWFGPAGGALRPHRGRHRHAVERASPRSAPSPISPTAPTWLSDPEHWQGVTRQLEDRLSDALHERLAQRFVDRRTSVLMRRLRENAMLDAEITAGGDVLVEGQHVGQLHGFRFTPDPQAAGEAARALNAAALKALGGRDRGARRALLGFGRREASRSPTTARLRWLGDPVAKLGAGDKLLAPRVRVARRRAYLTGLGARDGPAAARPLGRAAHQEASRRC